MHIGLCRKACHREAVRHWSAGSCSERVLARFRPAAEICERGVHDGCRGGWPRTRCRLRGSRPSRAGVRAASGRGWPMLGRRPRLRCSGAGNEHGDGQRHRDSREARRPPDLVTVHRRFSRAGVGQADAPPDGQCSRIRRAVVQGQEPSSSRMVSISAVWSLSIFPARATASGSSPSVCSVLAISIAPS